MMILISTLVSFFLLCGLLPADQEIVAAKVDGAPLIDGSADDAQWGRARTYVTRDQASGIDIELRALYTEKQIFILTRYPDEDESRSHKPWIWNQDSKVYEMGPDREDTFIFKWSLVGNQVDLGMRSDDVYSADVWFWKACRTDPSGYADDKIQRLCYMQAPKTKQVISRSGKTGFFSRRGDAGSSAYKSVVYIDYVGDRVPQYQWYTPTGSRGDIRAKGVWKDQHWTIEFSRALVTGHDDDIQFDIGGRYLFGISRYEIAGRQPDPSLTQPYYGSGDIGERLYLVFSK